MKDTGGKIEHTRERTREREREKDRTTHTHDTRLRHGGKPKHDTHTRERERTRERTRERENEKEERKPREKEKPEHTKANTRKKNIYNGRNFPHPNPEKKTTQPDENPRKKTRPSSTENNINAVIKRIQKKSTNLIELSNFTDVFQPIRGYNIIIDTGDTNIKPRDKSSPNRGKMRGMEKMNSMNNKMNFRNWLSRCHTARHDRSFRVRGNAPLRRMTEEVLEFLNEWNNPPIIEIEAVTD